MNDPTTPIIRQLQAEMPIRRLDRPEAERYAAGREETIDRWVRLNLPSALYGPLPATRRVAHVLTLLGHAYGDPTYTFECRATPRVRAASCAITCVVDDEPVRDCAAFLCGELDEAVKDLGPLRPGVYLVDVRGDSEGVILELLGQVGLVGDVSPFGVTVRPTGAMRYPGYGPEVEVRELIERTMSETPGAVEYGPDDDAITLDAHAAALAVLHWMCGRFDIPGDQMPAMGSAQSSLEAAQRVRLANVHPRARVSSAPWCVDVKHTGGLL